MYKFYRPNNQFFRHTLICGIKKIKLSILLKIQQMSAKDQ